MLAHDISGLTLIELLIALTLGSLIALSVTEFFLVHNQSIDHVLRQNEMHANMRFVNRLFSRSTKLAGYLQGADINQIQRFYQPLQTFPGACDSTWVLNLAESFVGFEGENSVDAISRLPQSCLPKDYLPDSDVLVVKYAKPDDVLLDSEVDNARYTNRYMLRAGGGSLAAMFDGLNSLEAMNTIPGNALVENRELVVSIYFLSRCQSSDCQGSGHVLNQISLEGRRFVRRKLVSGIAQLQFEYGYDNNGDNWVDEYKKADSVVNWRSVKSVRVYAVFGRSEPVSGVTQRSETIQLGQLDPVSLSVYSNNRHDYPLHRVMSFEIARRN